MADISTDLGAWSSTAASNNPSGSTIVGAGLDDNLRAIQAATRAEFSLLSSVAGTNTITATHPTLTAYYEGLRVWFVAAGANTAATTININSLGAKTVQFSDGVCSGGEIRGNRMYGLVYDGTLFELIAGPPSATIADHFAIRADADRTKKIAFSATGITTGTTRTWTAADRSLTVGGVTGTMANANTGTAVDFTGIPAGTKRITVMFDLVSTDGTEELLLQLGDSGGIEDTGYVGGVRDAAGTGAVFTSGFQLTVSNTAGDSHHGQVILTLMDAATFKWSCFFCTSDTATPDACHGAGTKSLSAELTQLRLTTTGTPDDFDGSGKINIMYE